MAVTDFDTGPSGNLLARTSCRPGSGVPGRQRGSHIIRYLAETATIVIGIPTERHRPSPSYVAGHGPATDRDLAWWSGLTVTDARLAMTLARVPGDHTSPLILYEPWV